MATATNYSFLDTQVTFLSPGGTFLLGSGSGAAEEGLTLSMLEDKNTMTIGADGSVMHSLHAGKGATLTVRLLKTSPTNNQLSLAYNIQTASSAAHGLNIISIRNNVSGDSITLTQVAFKKLPELTYAKEGGIMEWTFDCGKVEYSLGGGIIANLATFGIGSL
jgi:hypothetical protein